MRERIPSAARLRIAHLTDPQFGFGKEGGTSAGRYAADKERFKRAVARVNALKPDLALVTGDMVHRTDDMGKD